MKNLTAWENYSDNELKKVMRFNEDYKKFLGASKIEREAVINSIELAKKAGFKEFKNVKKIKAGDKFYFNNRNRSLALFVIGKNPIEDGMNLLGAHVDSPRIDLKQNPIYEDNGLVLFDTHYYGAIKKYQWVTLPLELHGTVYKKDGKAIDVVIGDDENEPVLAITDLLYHLSEKQRHKDGDVVIEGEDLDALVGSIPSKKKSVKENVIDILKKEYNIEPEDFLSAELELVPAGKPRDLGLDRSMVLGYAHDDKVCVYTSLRAILETESPERTSVCILTDMEEIGSVGATGAQSSFLENCIAELINLQDTYNELKLRRALANSYMLSSDVSMAFDPIYPEVVEPKSTAYLGRGMTFNKFTGARGKSNSSDCSASFIAKMRNVLDKNSIMYQFCEMGKVDIGGGGTIARFVANKNMDVLDAGVGVLSMHAPFEVVSKADVYEAYKAYKAFLKEVK